MLIRFSKHRNSFLSENLENPRFYFGITIFISYFLLKVKSQTYEKIFLYSIKCELQIYTHFFSKQNFVDYLKNCITSKNCFIKKMITQFYSPREIIP